MFEWLVSLMKEGGPFGVAVLMFVENVFPPIPSELVMPFAGFLAARDETGLAAAIAAGTAGSVAGAYLWYWLGYRYGEERLKALAASHGRWLTLSPAQIERAEDWFRRHGAAAVFFGRLVPGVRTLISVPAGVSAMPCVPFLLYSSLGSLVWTSLLAGAGYVLEGQYDRVSAWLNPVSNAVVIGLIGWYLWRVVTYRSRSGAR